ncbi:MAG TPA: phytanoyl-CoA dioxygenase family protein [Terriglobales bacterium]|nr:phytanoyl-CoA dioxygenase family protein [Terriglobales bacterium]
MTSDIADDLAALGRDGYVIVPELLGPAELDALRAELAAELARGDTGRNNFEGLRTQRIYSLVGSGPACERLALHPRILAICDALLEPGYLLTASQAICLLPGETSQPLHTDDSFYRIPRPRPAISISTIWAIDAFTEQNGATQVAPASHRWSDAVVGDLLAQIDFRTDRRQRPDEPALAEDLRRQLRIATMLAGSVIVFLGTLVHRGGANRSDMPRLGLSNQYCQPWARQQENFLLSIAAERARAMPDQLQQLLGYSIHPPFMGHVRGIHPRRWRDRV